jgi:hypothetical protein
VKVNGQDVAVLGCMVKTCNDPMDTETCQVIAAGATVSIPIQIPGLESPLVVNMREPIAKEAPIKNRSLENPKWSKTKANIGETVKLSVQCPGQYSNANVRFSIFPDGADTKNDPPLSFAGGQNKGGKAEAEWAMKLNVDLPPNDNSIDDVFKERMGLQTDSRSTRYYIQNYEDSFENPFGKTMKLFFTAKSFGCKEVKGGICEIGDAVEIKIVDSDENPIKDISCSTMGPDGKKNDAKTSSSGTVKQDAKIPGQMQIQIVLENDNENS